MSSNYVPLAKRSKRERKEYFAERRGSWGGIDPATRRSPDLKKYDRKKSGWRSGHEYEHEPPSGFFFAPGAPAFYCVMFIDVNRCRRGVCI